MQNENDSQTQAQFEDGVRQVLPVGDRPIVAQIICPKTGVRSEPLCGSVRNVQVSVVKVLEDEPKLADHYFVIIMDKCFNDQEDLAFSSCPVMTVASFASLEIGVSDNA
jgi:hypothetical protein